MLTYADVSGESLFSLSQLLSYRTGEYDPEIKLAELSDTNIAALVRRCMCICVSVCVCVCVCERERERECVCVSVSVSE
jgi:hypothetical protein